LAATPHSVRKGSAFPISYNLGLRLRRRGEASSSFFKRRKAGGFPHGKRQSRDDPTKSEHP